MSDYEKQANDFAKKHGIKLEVLDSRVGIHFDGDKDERRIFKLKLSRGGIDYVFDFGQSIINSCEKVSKKKIEVEDKIIGYVGLKTATSSCGQHITLYKKNEFSLSEAEIEELEKKLITEYYSKVNNQAKNIVGKFESGDISRKDMERRLNGINRLEDGAFLQCILRAVDRLHEEVTDVWVVSDKIVEPSMYSVLACLTKYDPYSFEDFCYNFGYDTDSRKAEKIYHAVVKEWEAVERLFGDILEELEEIQ
jgi:hypothetical protein